MSREHHSLAPYLQVFHRPENTLGTSRAINANALVVENGLIVSKVIKFSPAMRHMGTEIMINASDNKRRSIDKGYEPGDIRVNVDQDSMEVISGGAPMPVVKMESHTGEEVWLPSEMFEHVGSGSNYDDSGDRFTAGKNGVGAAVVLALSEYGILEVIDASEGVRKRFVQEWTKPDYNPDECGVGMSVEALKKNGRRHTEGPTIEELDDAIDYNMVRFKFIPVFNKFSVDHYNEDWMKMIHADVHFLAFCVRIPVYFNGQKIDYSISCTKLYSMLGVKKFVEIEASSYKYLKKKEPIHIAEWDITFFPKSTLGIISFANGTPTRSGGKHVENLIKSIASVISEAMAKSIYPDADDKRLALVTWAVKSELSCLLKVTVSKPEFNAQQKDKLDTDTYLPEFDYDQLKCLELEDTITKHYNKEIMEEVNEKVKKRREGGSRTLPKDLIDANNVLSGRRRADNCLNITEGKSASEYPDKGLKDRDRNGSLALRGKILNVTGKSLIKVEKNPVIRGIMDAIGLEFGVDYTSEAARSKLRYQKIRICTDQDLDGYHIQLLFINFIATYWKSLIITGCVSILSSPVKRAEKNGKRLSFYTEDDFLDWKYEAGNGWRIVHCKGLGTSNANDIAYDFRNGVVETVVEWDDESEEMLTKAFSYKLTNVRKQMLLDQGLIRRIVQTQKTTVPFLILSRWRPFSIENVSRGIPSFADGLKPVERKILYVIMKKYSRMTVKKDGDYTKIPICNIGGSVIDTADYHHGETSIYDCSAKMARGFPGSSNLPLLFPDGNFGSRRENGKNHSQARYIRTCPRSYMRLIFPEEDDAILQYTNETDSGHPCEPDFYLPILPLQLVNRTRGMGTGWSTIIPPCDPDDVIVELMNMLRGFEPNFVAPKYRYYRGTIYTHVKGTNEPEVEIVQFNDDQGGTWDTEYDDEEEETYEEEGGEEVEGQEEKFVISTTRSPHIEIIGDYDCELVDGRYHVTIRDIPPQYEFDEVYRKYREMKDRGILDDIYRHEGDFRFRYDVILSQTASESIKTRADFEKMLFLKSYESLNNMYLLNPEDKLPEKYTDSVDILKSFYEFRLAWYEKRKESMIAKLEHEKKIAVNQIKLIETVRSKEISLFREVERVDGGVSKTNLIGKSDAELKPDLEAHGIDIQYVDTDTRKHTDVIYGSHKRKLVTIDEQIQTIRDCAAEDLWYEDLERLLTYLREYYSKPTIDEEDDGKDVVEKKPKSRKK